MLIAIKQKHNFLKSRSEALELKIRDHELEVVQKTKYLGVQIDCSLDWKEQIKAVSAKVSKAIGFLRHNDLQNRENCPCATKSCSVGLHLNKLRFFRKISRIPERWEERNSGNKSTLMLRIRDIAENDIPLEVDTHQ